MLLAKARSETAALSRAVTDMARVYEAIASVNGPYVSRELRDLLAASPAVPAQTGEPDIMPPDGDKEHWRRLYLAERECRQQWQQQALSAPSAQSEKP